MARRHIAQSGHGRRKHSLKTHPRKRGILKTDPMGLRVAQGLEFLMICSTLLWAVEVAASPASKDHDKKIAQKTEGRGPATYGSSALKQLFPAVPVMDSLPKLSSSADDVSPELSVLKPGHFLSSEKVFTGTALSSSVKNDSFFAPDSFELFRFKLPN